MRTRFVMVLLVGTAAVAAFFIYTRTAEWDYSSPISLPAFGRAEQALFVGDIMLARNVEALSRAEGLSYPYRHVAALHERYSFVIGNFEASMAEPHEPTPSMVLRFSVAEALLEPLAESGMTHVSLANNHGLDYGEDGYDRTRAALTRVGIASFGHPVRVDASSVTFFDAGSVRVAVVGLHPLWREPTADELDAAFSEAASADVQIAYVHWGDEYEPVHNAAQEAFAHTLIAHGADAVIGMHPHVVQDIGMHDGVPIFYSLGNYIFDQYWEPAVEQGLAVAVTFHRDRLTYELIPVDSERSVPRPMEGVARGALLEGLAARSDESLAAEIQEGSFESTIR